jgi:cation transport ATPase
MFFEFMKYDNNKAKNDEINPKEKLHNNRLKQKQQYLQKVTTGVNTSHKSIQKTDKQTKKELNKRQKTNLNKKKKTKNTKKYKKDIARYERTKWTLMYFAVFFNFIGGFLTEFGIGYILTIPATLVIDFGLWNALDGPSRSMIRGLAVAMSVSKLIPFISALPTGLILVLLAHGLAYSKKKKAEAKLKL